MLVITKGILNQLCISANELSELTSPNYLFVFKGEEENINVACILSNTSGYTARYDLFAFTEGTDATLKYTGDYYLKVYEQESAVNLDPLLADKLIHEEEVLVLKEPFIYKENNPDVIKSIHEFS